MIRILNKSSARSIIRFLDDAGIVRFGRGDDVDFNAKELFVEPFETKDIYNDEIITKNNKKVLVKRILPPVEPTSIIGIGLNYKLHAKETGQEVPRNPIMFMKNISSTNSHNGEIIIPKVCEEREEVDYEVELAVVIGKIAKDVTIENALSYVFGYTIANDVSARRWQGKLMNNQWVRSKSFDTFCPLGPRLVLSSSIPNPQTLNLSLSINDREMQNSNTSDMIFSVAQIVSFCSQDTTLLPGTVILTGTPEGVGFTRKPPIFLKNGDVVKCSIDQIGTLRNRVVNKK